jgi:hypothetical protein
MSWCEQNAVDYVFGLAKNTRLVRAIGAELHEAAAESARSLRPARRAAIGSDLPMYNFPAM